MPTILLVEDNELNRDMLSRRLVRNGYDVLIAEDGAKGLSAATDGKPDLILMDMSLPVIDGWEATRRLKAAPQTQSIPVIALTAHAMSSDREKPWRRAVTTMIRSRLSWSACSQRSNAFSRPALNEPRFTHHP